MAGPQQHSEGSTRVGAAFARYSAERSPSGGSELLLRGGTRPWISGEAQVVENIAAARSSLPAGVTLTRELYRGSDGHLARYTMLRVPPGELLPRIEVDLRALHLGIELQSPTSAKIEPYETTKRWGSEFGRVLESGLSGRAFAFYPNHWGADRGAFLFQDGKILRLKNDQVDDQFGVSSFIGFDTEQKRWIHANLADCNLASISVGWSAPFILREGRVIEPSLLASDPRVFGDIRNFIDLTSTEGSVAARIPGEFWSALARLAAVLDPRSVKSLLEGGEVSVTTANPFSRSEQTTLTSVCEALLFRSVRFEFHEAQGTVTFHLKGPFRPSRQPFVATGVTRDGALLVMVVDGRQPDSGGMSVQELAREMALRGAVFGGLGCAGGDVALAASGVEGAASAVLLNSPSTVSADTPPVRHTRRVAARLVLQVPSDPVAAPEVSESEWIGAHLPPLP